MHVSGICGNLTTKMRGFAVIAVLTLLFLYVVKAENTAGETRESTKYKDTNNDPEIIYLDLMLKLVRTVIHVHYLRYQNVLVSPALLTSPVTLLSHAASEDVLHEIAVSMMNHLPRPVIYKNLGDLRARVKTSTPTPHDDALQIDNYMLIRKWENSTMKETFAHLAKNYYKIAIQHGIKDKSMEDIEKEHPDNNDVKGIKIIVNTGYHFRVKWETKLSSHSKYKALFSVSPEERITTQFMSARDFHPAWFDSSLDCSILELPLYPKGSDMSFMIFSPKTAFGLEYLEKLLMVGSRLKSILESPKRKDKVAVAYSMPRLEFQNNIDGSKVWSNMGAKKLFEPGNKGLTNIDDADDLHVNKFFHSTYLKLDEEGGEDESIGTPRESTEHAMSVVLDHPFIFMIIHKSSNSVHAIGRIVRPVEGPSIKDEL